MNKLQIATRISFYSFISLWLLLATIMPMTGFTSIVFLLLNISTFFLCCIEFIKLKILSTEQLLSTLGLIITIVSFGLML